MLDIGFSKLLLIGGIALVVIGPERLPRVARMAGTLLGRAQRYVSDVKAEVNRSMEMEELQKVRKQFETSTREVEQSISEGLNEAAGSLDMSEQGLADNAAPAFDYAPVYRHPKKNWRLKRAAKPQWFKHQIGQRVHVQSGAARVARFRPRPTAGSRP